VPKIVEPSLLSAKRHREFFTFGQKGLSEGAAGFLELGQSPMKGTVDGWCNEDSSNLQFYKC
jgi:hypothetical protein